MKDLLVDGGDDELQIQLAMGFPVIGLGAPVASYYPKTAQWLKTECLLPEQGSVANALGAIVGSVRQTQELSITAAGGKNVNLHLPDGTTAFDDLESAASTAISFACDAAVKAAQCAGATNISVEHERIDNIVQTDGESVFFESRIVATAVGRPVRSTNIIN